MRIVIEVIAGIAIFLIGCGVGVLLTCLVVVSKEGGK